MIRSLAIFVFAASLLPSSSVYAQAPDPATVVQAFYAASNRSNDQAAAAQLAPDATLTFGVGNPARPEGGRFIGLEGLRQRFQIQASENVVDEISEIRVSGERVTWTDLHTNDIFRHLNQSHGGIYMVLNRPSAGFTVALV